MLDAKLWAEILDAPTALAMQDAGLQAAIIERLRREFGLNAERGAMVLFNYRRFRYLAAVSTEPLAAPPLIAFVQERDVTNSDVFDEGKWWLSRSVWINQSTKLSFEKNPAYQLTLDHYEQEFKSPPMPKIWPPVSFRRSQLRVLAICFFGFAVIIIGVSLKLDSLIWAGALTFSAALLHSVFNRHWAEPFDWD